MHNDCPDCEELRERLENVAYLLDSAYAYVEMRREGQHRVALALKVLRGEERPPPRVPAPTPVLYSSSTGGVV